ncbi:hypothetical protein N2152v2_004299 [Parachlorella kessleri]
MTGSGDQQKHVEAAPATVEEEEEDLDALWGGGPARVVQQQEPTSSEEDSYFQDSDAESEDSATRRRKAAEARLRDFGEPEREKQDDAGSAAAAAGLLPSAAAAFTDVGGPPAFLDPEATRPLAVGSHRTIDRVGTGAAAADAEHEKQAGGGGKAKPGWDISKMAPKLKGESKPAEPGVISGAAVKYKPQDDGQAVTAAQIAMLGGQWGRTAGGGANGEDGDGEEEGGGAPGAALPPKGKPTRPMGVEEFLEKGVGGAQLPRKRQDRKDKEKDKRAKGQSSHHQWKTEAEMLLRQQYD